MQWVPRLLFQCHRKKNSIKREQSSEWEEIRELKISWNSYEMILIHTDMFTFVVAVFKQQTEQKNKNTFKCGNSYKYGYTPTSSFFSLIVERVLNLVLHFINIIFTLDISFEPNQRYHLFYWTHSSLFITHNATQPLSLPLAIWVCYTGYTATSLM